MAVASMTRRGIGWGLARTKSSHPIPVSQSSGDLQTGVDKDKRGG